VDNGNEQRGLWLAVVGSGWQWKASSNVESVELRSINWCSGVEIWLKKGH